MAAVAEVSHLTASAVSQSLAELEREAGVAILRPMGRRVVLTDAGISLLPHIDAIIGEMESAHATLERGGGSVVGEVAIASIETAAVTILPKVLQEMRAIFPQVTITTVQSETAPALAAVRLGQVDIALCAEYDHVPAPRQTGVIRIPLADESMIVALPIGHPLSGPERGLSLRDLADEVWGAGATGGHAAFVTRMCELHGGFTPNILHRADDLVVLRALVAAGMATTLLPDLLLPLDHASVVPLHFAEANPMRRLFMATRPVTQLSLSVQRVMDSVRHQTAHLVAAVRGEAGG